jgi:hypothetical protein
MGIPTDICKEGMQSRTDKHEHARMNADFRVVHVLVRQSVVSLRIVQNITYFLPPVSGGEASRSSSWLVTRFVKNVLNF